MTKKELKLKLDALGELDEDVKKKIVCSLIGHSNIMTSFMGYHYCGRCDDQIGDSLGSLYENNKAVYVGHNCDVCNENYKNLTWKDKYLAPSKEEIFS